MTTRTRVRTDAPDILIALDQAKVAEERRIASNETELKAALAAAHNEGEVVYRLNIDEHTAPGKLVWERDGYPEDHTPGALQTSHLLVVRPGMTSRAILADAGMLPRPTPRELAAWCEIAYAEKDLATAVLALLVADEVMEWNSHESLQAAARRLCLEAAWPCHVSGQVTSERALWNQLARTLGLDDSPSVLAAAYLARRVDIKVALTDLGVHLGGELLTYTEAAERAGVLPGTWRSYVSQGYAPTPDATGPNRWHPATLAAWKLNRPGPGARTDRIRAPFPPELVTNPNTRTVQNPDFSLAQAAMDTFTAALREQVAAHGLTLTDVRRTPEADTPTDTLRYGGRYAWRLEFSTGRSVNLLMPGASMDEILDERPYNLCLAGDGRWTGWGGALDYALDAAREPARG